MKNKILVIVSTLTIILVSSVIIFWVGANRPFARAKTEAIEIAKGHTDLVDVSLFYWFTREESYFTILGTDSKDNQIVVMIPQSGEKVTVLNQADGINESAAIKAVGKAKPGLSIMHANLGMVDEQPSWEVVAKGSDGTLNYYLLDFKTGEIYSSIENV